MFLCGNQSVYISPAGVPIVAQWLANLTSIHEDAGLTPSLTQWLAESCGVGHRCALDPALLWLWHRLEATAPIRPLAWEPPYAAGAGLENGKKTQKNK